MQREGYRESTCYFTVRTLKRLDRKVNILEPEIVLADEVRKLVYGGNAVVCAIDDTMM